MNPLFKNIGLFDTLDFETEISKTEFIITLRKLIYKSDFSIFEAADYSIPNRFEYRGFVNESNFMIRRRKHFFDSNIPNPNIKGIIYEANGKTYIKAEFSPVKYIFVTLISFTVLFLILFFITDEIGFRIFSMAAILMINFNYYFTLTTAIRKNKYDFERELNFIAQKNNQFKNYR